MTIKGISWWAVVPASVDISLDSPDVLGEGESLSDISESSELTKIELSPTNKIEQSWKSRETNDEAMLKPAISNWQKRRRAPSKSAHVQ